MSLVIRSSKVDLTFIAVASGCANTLPSFCEPIKIGGAGLDSNGHFSA